MEEGGGKMEFNTESVKEKAQPTEYVLTVPEMDAELEIGIQHPKKHKKPKENM